MTKNYELKILQIHFSEYIFILFKIVLFYLLELWMAMRTQRFKQMWLCTILVNVL